MKKAFRAVLIFLCVLVASLAMPVVVLLGLDALFVQPQLKEFRAWSSTLPIQTEMPAYMVDGRVVLPDGKSFYVENVLEEQYDMKDISVELPACIIGDMLYVVHTIPLQIGWNGLRPWCISAVRLDTMEADICYTHRTPQENCSVRQMADYPERSAWYEDGMIWLNDGQLVTAYDIDTGTVKTLSCRDAVFPERIAWGEHIGQDDAKLILHMDGKETTLTLAGIAAGNPVVGEVVEKMVGKAGKRNSRFDEAFSADGVQTADGQTWLLVRGVVYGCNGWMLFLRWDEAAECWLYAGCEYSFDGRHYDYWVIPTA